MVRSLEVPVSLLVMRRRVDGRGQIFIQQRDHRGLCIGGEDRCGLHA